MTKIEIKHPGSGTPTLYLLVELNHETDTEIVVAAAWERQQPEDQDTPERWVKPIMFLPHGCGMNGGQVLTIDPETFSVRIKNVPRL